MKHIAITLGLAALATAMPAAKGPLNAVLGSANAWADASLHSPYPMRPEETFETWVRKRNALRTLREETIKLQQADGGKLTQAHHHELQVRYDAIMSGNY